jgi:micrococcal nuclease
MPGRLIALLILSRVLAVFGQDQLKPTTYYLDLEQALIRGRCVGVTDGDTIKVLTTTKEQIRVRIAFIDAPEKGQAFGQRAKQAMSALVFGKEVELRPHTIDRYGRLVARVIVGGQDTGLELLKAGLCWVYQKYVAQAPLELEAGYRAAEALPRSDKLGLWQDPAPVAPWEWRKEKHETSGVEVGGTEIRLTVAASAFMNLASSRIESRGAPTSLF